MSAFVASEAKSISERWNLNESITDEMVLEDVENAIFEALMTGICLGGMDHELAEEATEYCSNITG